MTTAAPIFNDVSNLAKSDNPPIDAPFSFVSPWRTSPILFVNNISKEEHNDPALWNSQYPPYGSSPQRKLFMDPPYTKNDVQYKSHPTYLNGGIYSPPKYSPDSNLSYGLSPEQMVTQEKYYKEIKEKYITGSHNKQHPRPGTLTNPQVYVPASNSSTLGTQQNFTSQMEHRNIRDTLKEEEEQKRDIPPDYISLEDRLRLCSMDLIHQPPKSKSSQHEPMVSRSKPSSVETTQRSHTDPPPVNTVRSSSSLGDYKTEYKPAVVGILKSTPVSSPMSTFSAHSSSLHNFDLINRPVSLPIEVRPEDDIPNRFSNYRGTPIPFDYPKFSDAPPIMYPPITQAFNTHPPIPAQITPPYQEHEASSERVVLVAEPPFPMDQFGYHMSRPHSATPYIPQEPKDIFPPGPLDYRPRYGQFFKRKTNSDALHLVDSPKPTKPNLESTSKPKDDEKSQSQIELSRRLERNEELRSMVEASDRPDANKSKLKRSNSFHSSGRRENQNTKVSQKEQEKSEDPSYVNLSKLRRSLSERREPVYIKPERPESRSNDNRFDSESQGRSESPDKQRLVSETRSEPERASSRSSRWERYNKQVSSTYPDSTRMKEAPANDMTSKSDPKFLHGERENNMPENVEPPPNPNPYQARSQSLNSSSTGFDMNRPNRNTYPDDQSSLYRPNYKSQFMRQYFGEGLRANERQIANSVDYPSSSIKESARPATTFPNSLNAKYYPPFQPSHSSRFSEQKTNRQDSYLNELRRNNNIKSATLPQRSSEEPTRYSNTYTREIDHKKRLEELTESLKAEQAAHNALKNSINTRISFENKDENGKKHRPRRSRSVHFNEDVTVAHRGEDDDPFQLSSRRLNDGKVLTSSSQPYYKQGAHTNNYFNFPTFSPRFNGKFSSAQIPVGWNIGAKMESDFSRRVAYPIQF